jgi:hypothetical protein
MTKHPHRLILQERKTWRCTLEGCSFFVHLGLAHVLIGKTAICWDCGESYTIDPDALKEDMPKCVDCRSGQDQASLNELAKLIERKLALARAGVKDEKELTPMQRNTMRALGVLPKEDEIEVIPEDETHSPDCDIYSGGDCDCK